MITNPSAIPPAARRAFTLVELLVSIAIIVLLVGILIPATSLVLRGARESANQSLLRALADGAYSFNSDLGYYPPLLTPDPDLPGTVHAPDHTDSSRTPGARASALEDVRWHSVVTPVVYLLGLGEIAPDPLDAAMPTPDWLTDSSNPNYANRHDGAEGLGIRNPGPDRSWGGAVSRSNHRPSFAGRVYGPYIDPKIGETQVRFAQVEDFPYRTQFSPPLDEQQIRDMQLFVITDRYDTPIRYYKDWPERDRSSSPTSGGTRVPTLADAPIELVPSELLEDYAQAESEPDLLPVAGLAGQSCAFLSAGGDTRWGERVREELPQSDLLVARDIRDVAATADNNLRQRVLEAVSDNQRATPQ